MNGRRYRPACATELTLYANRTLELWIIGREKEISRQLRREVNEGGEGEAECRAKCYRCSSRAIAEE